MQLNLPQKIVNVFLDVSLCGLEARKNKRLMKVPKGTSDYQAAWIVDDEDEENGEIDEESSDDDDDNDDMLDEAMDGDDEEVQTESILILPGNC